MRKGQVFGLQLRGFGAVEDAHPMLARVPHSGSSVRKTSANRSREGRGQKKKGRKKLEAEAKKREAEAKRKEKAETGAVPSWCHANIPARMD